MTAQKPVRRRRTRVQPVLICWLTVVWLMLWGEISVANVVSGLVVALVVTLMLPLPPVEFSGRPHLVGIIVLLGRFAIDVVVASIQISYVAVRRRKPRGAVIAVPLKSRSDLYLTLVSDFQTLVPGSLIVEAKRATSTLYVHIFDPVDDAGVEKARRGVYELEERVMRALASDAELAAAGLAPRGRLRWRIPMRPGPVDTPEGGDQ